jgi:hypothetical protein
MFYLTVNVHQWLLVQRYLDFSALIKKGAQATNSYYSA